MNSSRHTPQLVEIISKIRKIRNVLVLCPTCKPTTTKFGVKNRRKTPEILHNVMESSNRSPVWEKFDMKELTDCVLYHAEFDLDRCIVSPIKVEKREI